MGLGDWLEHFMRIDTELCTAGGVARVTEPLHVLQSDPAFKFPPTILAVRFSLRYLLDMDLHDAADDSMASALRHVVAVKELVQHPWIQRWWGDMGTDPQHMWTVEGSSNEPSDDKMLGKAYTSLFPSVIRQLCQTSSDMKTVSWQQVTEAVDASLELTPRQQEDTVLVNKRTQLRNVWYKYNDKRALADGWARSAKITHQLDTVRQWAQRVWPQLPPDGLVFTDRTGMDWPLVAPFYYRQLDPEGLQPQPHEDVEDEEHLTDQERRVRRLVASIEHRARVTLATRASAPASPIHPQPDHHQHQAATGRVHRSGSDVPTEPGSGRRSLPARRAAVRAQRAAHRQLRGSSDSEPEGADAVAEAVGRDRDVQRKLVGDLPQMRGGRVPGGSPGHERKGAAKRKLSVPVSPSGRLPAAGQQGLGEKVRATAGGRPAKKHRVGGQAAVRDVYEFVDSEEEEEEGGKVRGGAGQPTEHVDLGTDTHTESDSQHQAAPTSSPALAASPRPPPRTKPQPAKRKLGMPRRKPTPKKSAAKLIKRATQQSAPKPGVAQFSGAQQAQLETGLSTAERIRRQSGALLAVIGRAVGLIGKAPHTPPGRPAASPVASRGKQGSGRGKPRLTPAQRAQGKESMADLARGVAAPTPSRREKFPAAAGKGKR